MFKVIQDNKIIDVIKNSYFVKFLPSGHVAFTDRLSADGIVGSDEFTVYSFKPRLNYKTVTIEEISIDEFSRLQGLLNSGQALIADKAVIEELKTDAINRLSNICKNKIIDGFSLTLSDHKRYDFRLTQEDQLNLLALEGQLNSGAETFVYHATNQPCKVFLREDMIKIIKTYWSFVRYHTTYFNVAKQYIESLNDMEKIKCFEYGENITEIVESNTIKQILKDGGRYI